MIIVLQGTPGSGKTTALQSISSIPGIAAVPEILLAPSIDLNDDFFLRNDMAKTALAISHIGTSIMDRDFTSTLAFVIARDGQQSATAQAFTRQVDRGLLYGQLLVPDVFLLFHLEPHVSLQRQLLTNAPVWGSLDFVYRVDCILSEIVAKYIPSDIIEHIDGDLSKKAITERLTTIITRSSHEITHPS